MPEIVISEQILNQYLESKNKGVFVGESKQCVSLVKDAMQKHLGKTPEQSKPTNWRPANAKVVDSTSKLKKGTLIATFDSSKKYPNKETGNHAAIYISSDQSSITVLEQYGSSNGLIERTIRKKEFECNFELDYKKKEHKPKKPSNNADCYYPIIVD